MTDMTDRSIRQGTAQIGGFLRAAGTALFVFVLGCGVGDHVDVPGDGADSGARVASDVNVCPHFEGSLILPQRIRPSESALIAVRATDPDAADSLLAFAWTSASGTFSASDKPVTEFNCSRVGPEQLKVTAMDQPGCITGIAIPVECVEQ